MIRRWSYIRLSSNINIKNITNPAGIKLFKSCVRVRNTAKHSTHLARKKYFIRRLKNSLTLFLILSSRWLSDFLSVKKNLKARFLTNIIYSNLPTTTSSKGKNNLTFNVMDFSYSKSLQLPSYITITPQPYYTNADKFSLDQLKFFSLPSQLIISLLKCYRYVIVSILITSITK